MYVVSIPSSHSTRLNVKKPTVELKMDLHKRLRVHTWTEVSNCHTHTFPIYECFIVMVQTVLCAS